MYHFVKGGNDSLSKTRRESMFIQILEGLHPLESEILCLVKDKKLESKYKITQSVVESAHTDIQWGEAFLMEKGIKEIYSDCDPSQQMINLFHQIPFD